MKIDHVHLADRDARARYIVEQFRPLLKGRLLDVGCDTRRIHALVPELDYVGIDIGGTPDLRINLEEAPELPFEDRSFDCVICTDVLEHLDNLHMVFDNLARVTRGYLIISLPNCWRTMRNRLPRGKGTPHYYGLPADRPEDRHKWFFNVSDVVGFMQERSGRHGLEVVEFRGNLNPDLWPVRAVRRIRYPDQSRYLNRYAHSVWTVLRRRS